MKLSKRNQDRLRAIRKALADGKPLGGLLAGMLSIAATGCNPGGSHGGPIGRFPEPRHGEQTRCGSGGGESSPRVPMGDVPAKTPLEAKATDAQASRPGDADASPR